MRKRRHSAGPLGVVGDSDLALPPQAGDAQSGHDPPLRRAGTPQPMQRLRLGRCRFVRPAMMRPSPCMAEADRQAVHAYGFGDAIPSSDWPWRVPHGRDPADGHRTAMIALGRPGPRRHPRQPERAVASCCRFKAHRTRRDRLDATDRFGSGATRLDPPRRACQDPQRP